MQAQNYTDYSLDLTTNFEPVVNSFISSRKQKCERTLKTYAQGITYFLRMMRSQNKVAPTETDLNNYLELLINGNDKLGIASKSDTTINSYLTSIRQFFEWAEREGFYPNIAKGFNNIDIEQRHRKDALTTKQALEVLDAVKRDSLQGKRDFAIITLLLNTGLRTCEIERANIEDLDIIEGFNVLRVQGKGCRFKSQYVKITDNVMDALVSYLTERQRKAGRMLQPNEPLFISVSNRDFGCAITARSVSRICKQALRKAGFDSKRLTAHSFRHTAATIALEAGTPAREVQKMTRHKDAKTLELYAHDKKRLTDAAEDAIEQALNDFASIDSAKVINFEPKPKAGIISCLQAQSL